MITPFLIGSNIYLRALNEKDLEGNYLQWLNDSDVCKYNSHHVFPYDRESAEKYIKNTYNSKTSLVLAIVLIEKDIHIGNIALQNIDYISRNAEFAILIGEKSYWGKGYSKEAGLLILIHGFIELNLHRIYCGTSVDNIPMQ
ncbi:MAG: GNAT family N-acetyltransferase, partial [Candidatus Eremiobacterota bacterium]